MKSCGWNLPLLVFLIVPLSPGRFSDAGFVFWAAPRPSPSYRSPLQQAPSDRSPRPLRIVHLTATHPFRSFTPPLRIVHPPIRIQGNCPPTKSLNLVRVKIHQG